MLSSYHNVTFLYTIHGSPNILKHLFLCKIDALRADTEVGKRDRDEGIPSDQGKFYIKLSNVQYCGVEFVFMSKKLIIFRFNRYLKNVASLNSQTKPMEVCPLA